MERPPLKVVQNFYNLIEQANVAAAAIAFNTVALESDRCVAAFEAAADGPGQLVTVDLRTFEVARRNNKGEAVLPHPNRNWVAVRARSALREEHTTVLVYNMEKREKMLASTVPEQVKFWVWLDDNVLGVVGASNVFQISTDSQIGADSEVPAERVYAREGALAAGNPVQVVDHGYLASRRFAYCCALSKKGDVVGGDIQLTSLALGKSQFFEGYTACFGRVRPTDEGGEVDVFAYSEKSRLVGKVTVSEIGAAVGGQKFKHVIEMAYPEGHETDFPLFMSIEARLGLLFLATKLGLLFVFELSEGALLLRSRVSAESSVIKGCPATVARGCLLLTRAGNLISIAVDEQPFVDFIAAAAHIKNNAVVARRLALRAGLPGSEGLWAERFNALFAAADFEAAARLAARSPGAVLRNRATLERFRAAPSDGGPHPLLRYFSALLETGVLNETESVELCRLVAQQGRVAMVNRWLDEAKLALTEELGDLLRPFDSALAERVYASCGSIKLLPLRVQRGGTELEAAIAGATSEALLAQLRALCASEPSAALTLAKSAARLGRVSAIALAEAFIAAETYGELAAFALECLSDAPENAPMQTQVFELCLKSAPSLAETLFQNVKWTRYDRRRVAALCEQKGLSTRALENFTDSADICRVLRTQANALSLEFLRIFIGSQLAAENVVAAISELLRSARNPRATIEIAQIAARRVGARELAAVFETAAVWEGVFLLLQSAIAHSRDAAVHNKFIEACVRTNQFAEIERLLQASESCYAPERALELLLGARLSDPKSLIILCDRHGFIAEMVRYLIAADLHAYLEAYLLRVSAARAPEVFAALLEQGAEESYVRQLLAAVGPNCPLAAVAREFEQRGRARLLEHWLAQRLADGSAPPPLHSAMARLLIDHGDGAARFLAENRYYEAKAVGAYAESRDPQLAFLAYSRDAGSCDADVLRLAAQHGMHRQLAEYLVARQSRELWTEVLAWEGPNRARVVEEAVSGVLCESQSVEEVSAAVHALIQADMSAELLDLLDRLVLHVPLFTQIRKLQNLLIFTAMRTDRGRVMAYLTQLNNYDWAEVAKAALDPQCAMYEEAFAVYRKMGESVEALNVLFNQLGNPARATDFAERVNASPVWQALGRAQLRAGRLREAVDAFVCGQDAASAEEVIALGHANADFETLLRFLEMAREQRRSALLDEEQLYCLARLDRLSALELALGTPTAADVVQLGERLFAEKRWEAARLLFTHAKNNARLAVCLLRLGELAAAVESAKRAGNARTWKEVANECLRRGEFRLAAVAASHLLVGDQLEDLARLYELHNAAGELIAVLEQAAGDEKAPAAVFTELATLYARHAEDRLLPFLKANVGRVNVNRLTRLCRQYGHWPAVVFLQTSNKDNDGAVRTMMEHSPTCFVHELFVTSLLRIAAADLPYQALAFYIDEEPLLLSDFLRQAGARLDATRAVEQLRRANCLPLAMEWLKAAQASNIPAVSKALNAIYLETGDFAALRESVKSHEAADALGLAQELCASPNAEMRRVAALIYRRSRQYREAIDLSVLEGNYGDAIETARESGRGEFAEQLARLFAETGRKEQFALVTATCADLLPPDSVLELAWHYGLTDFAMPFLLHNMRELDSRAQSLARRVEELERHAKAKQERSAKPPLGAFAAPALLSAAPMLAAPAPDFSALGASQPFGNKSI